MGKEGGREGGREEGFNGKKLSVAPSVFQLLQVHLPLLCEEYSRPKLFQLQDMLFASRVLMACVAVRLLLDNV